MDRTISLKNRIKQLSWRIWIGVLAALLLVVAVLSVLLLRGGEGPSVPLLREEAGHHHEYGEELPVGKDKNGYLFTRTCTACGEVDERYYTALVTFIDDDAKTAAMLHWERIIDATGIEMTCAIIPGKINATTDYDLWYSYAGWDLLDRLGEKGVDYVHHTYHHQRLGTFTEEQLHEDFRLSKEILNAHGIHSDLLVYPFYNHTDTVEQVAATYFDAAFGGEKDVSASLDTPNFAIKRVKTTNPKKVKTITFPDGRVAECQGLKNVGLLKRELRQAVADGDWLVYVTHAYDSPNGKYYFDEESEQTIIDFCHYVQGRTDVKIVNATDGYRASLPIE